MRRCWHRHRQSRSAPWPEILTKNHEHYRRALTRLPLGVASNFRFWGEERTIYVKHGRGARVTDLDDNVYVDYRMGYGPAILGYADPRVDEAAREGMEVGGVFALSTEREYRVAERIAQMVPAAELVRFSNSGTEAVMAALRLARAYTGATTTSFSRAATTACSMRPCGTRRWRSGPQVGDPVVYPYSEGVPLATRNFAHFVQANDANQLEDVLQRHGELDRLPADRADHGQLPGDRRRAGVRARGARAVRPLRRGADHR